MEMSLVTIKRVPAKASTSKLFNNKGIKMEGIGVT